MITEPISKHLTIQQQKTTTKFTWNTLFDKWQQFWILKKSQLFHFTKTSLKPVQLVSPSKRQTWHQAEGHIKIILCKLSKKLTLVKLTENLKLDCWNTKKKFKNSSHCTALYICSHESFMTEQHKYDITNIAATMK